MEVVLAVQLLLEVTSKSLKYFGKEGLFQEKHWKNNSQFIALSDRWFDLFSSSVPEDAKASRNAYGLSLSNQNKLLEDMTCAAKTMKVSGAKVLYPFEKELLYSPARLSKLMEMPQN